MLVAVAGLSFVVGAAVMKATDFPLTGRIVDIRSTEQELVIAHDPVSGYMGAMTMPFRVRDARELNGLGVGDKIRAELSVSANDAVIFDLRRTDDVVSRSTEAAISGGLMLTARRALPADREPAADRALPADLASAAERVGVAQELALGERVPEISGMDEHGSRWTLSDFRGRVVAVTFIYTRCALPTYCPMMSRNFATARALLGQLTRNSGERFQFLSLTLDSAHDSADVLRQYAQSFRSEPQGWLFAAPDQTQLRAFADAVGLEYRETPTAIDHNLRTVVIDREGRMRKIFRGNSWSPQELASEMKRAW